MPFHSRKSAKARKIAGSLIAAFPDAAPPLVWKFDLEKNHSFTLTLQGEEGDWELGVTSPRGEFYAVARFLSRDDAEEAFARTQCTLLRGERKFWSIAGPISTVLLVMFLVLSWVGHVRHEAALALKSPSLSMQSMHMPTPGFEPAASPMEMKEGVPVPADQVLVPPP